MAWNFNPRSPWGERLLRPENIRLCQIFQSTLPVGGATGHSAPHSSSQNYFNPRSPWGERPYGDGMSFGEYLFQSTLPVGGATMTSCSTPQSSTFQSTLPVGGATGEIFAVPAHMDDFNPRSPWGERLQRCTNNWGHLWRELTILYRKTEEIGFVEFQKEEKRHGLASKSGANPP